MYEVTVHTTKDEIDSVKTGIKTLLEKYGLGAGSLFSFEGEKSMYFYIGVDKKEKAKNSKMLYRK